MSPIKCPGQNSQFWGPEDVFDIPCPACKAPVEFFKDEVKTKCRKCGKMVLNPRIDLGCAQWCPQAEECLGPERYKDIVEFTKREAKRKRDMERLLSLIKAEDTDVKTLFKKLYLENKDHTKLFDTQRLKAIKETDPDLFKRATGYFSRFKSE